MTVSDHDLSACLPHIKSPSRRVHHLRCPPADCVLQIIPVSAEDMERANALPSIDLGHIFPRATGDSSGGGLSGGAIFGESL